MSSTGYCIIQTDNYGGDYPDEKFLAGWKDDEPHTGPGNLRWTYDPSDAQIWADDPTDIAGRINKAWGEDHLRYARVVPVGYKLKPGFEP